jgi:hypothetical protein
VSYNLRYYPNIFLQELRGTTKNSSHIFRNPAESRTDYLPNASLKFPCWNQQVIVKDSVVWDTRSCSPEEANRRFGGKCNSAFCLISCLAYSTTMKMCPSEISVDVHRTTRRCTQEAGNPPVRNICTLNVRLIETSPLPVQLEGVAKGKVKVPLCLTN